MEENSSIACLGTNSLYRKLNLIQTKEEMEELINILNSNDEDTYCIGMHILDNTDLRRLRPECIGMLKVWIRDENFVILTQHLNKDWIRWFKKLRNRVWNLYGL